MEKHKELNHLKEKYWAAETSLKEEELILNMTEKDLEGENLYFEALRQYKKEKTMKTAVKRKRIFSLSVLASAASICLFLTIGARYWLDVKPVEENALITYTEEEALEISSDALLYVASKLKSITSK